MSFWKILDRSSRKYWVSDAVLQWFLQLKEADKYVVLRELWGLARQANVCEEDIILGASRCGLKNTLESQTTT